MSLANDPRFDTEQAAKYLGPHISPRTLTQWRWRGVGPVFVKAGRRVQYLRSDLDAFLASCRRTSTSDVGPRAA